jgi:translation initiation factor 5
MAPLLLIHVFMTEDIVNELQTYRHVFLSFCMNNKKAQRSLLGGIEQFLEENPGLMSRAPHIIKALYDLNICEKKVILSWGAKVSEKCREF